GRELSGGLVRGERALELPQGFLVFAGPCRRDAPLELEVQLRLRVGSGGLLRVLLRRLRFAHPAASGFSAARRSRAISETLRRATNSAMAILSASETLRKRSPNCRRPNGAFLSRTTSATAVSSCGRPGRKKRSPMARPISSG